MTHVRRTYGGQEEGNEEEGREEGGEEEGREEGRQEGREEEEGHQEEGRPVSVSSPATRKEVTPTRLNP